MKIIVAIAVIGALETLAIFKGLDGALFGLVITAIAGLGGYEIKKYRDKKKPD